ncbi:hypothetical protein HMPREF1147_1313 [Selenomonas sp. FOBRC9]|uniref:hypothetical protein n=1 Tax=Selenomonas sp. FOBRC9 TaxID=936573 RepID=UPI00027A6046|nr:hypothetical protein [Selenomonas sp. FOBRC9]EJP32280.1 hypothetical protein HMPREF1147_1313 [Selenomonas sp. FOBRC9]
MIKPIPCMAFRNASTKEWMEKLAEETEEVLGEADLINLDLDRIIRNRQINEHLAEELTDVITVCVSWLDALGYNEEERDEWQRRVNEKNRKRGYHEEAQ